MHTTYTSPEPPNFSHLAIIITNETHPVTPYPCACAHGHTLTHSLSGALQMNHNSVRPVVAHELLDPQRRWFKNRRKQCQKKTYENKTTVVEGGRTWTAAEAATHMLQESERYCHAGVMRCEASVRPSVNLTAAVEEEIWPQPALQNWRKSGSIVPCPSTPSLFATTPDFRHSHWVTSTSPPHPTHTHSPLTKSTYYLLFTCPCARSYTSYRVTHMLFIYRGESVTYYLLWPCPRGVTLLFTTLTVVFSVTHHS